MDATSRSDAYYALMSETQSYLIPIAQPASRRVLWLELGLIFFLVPLLIFVGLWPKRLLMVALLGCTSYAVLVARRQGALKSELGIDAAGHDAAGACIRFGGAIWAVSLICLLLVHHLFGFRLFPLVQDRPDIFALLCAVYAISVSAQEFSYRSFFFWRYRPLFGDQALLIVNVLAFGWAHIIFQAWLPVALTLIGGLFFGLIYRRYRSLAGIAVIHALFGISLFATGYGKFFYGGGNFIAAALMHSGP